MECTENRKLEQHSVPDKLPEEALEILKKASKERDLEDFRDVSGRRSPSVGIRNHVGLNLRV